MTELENLRNRIAPLKEQLLNHSVYEQIRSIESLKIFMEHHVFAVWDFMSLLKAMQRELSCVEVPWIPNQNSSACRMINDIVLGEESDQDSQGGYASHFDLYRDAMVQCGAQTETIDHFIGQLKNGSSVSLALEKADVPDSLKQFVTQTFEVIGTKDLCAIASTFTFGREDLLPDLFRKIVDELDSQTEGGVSLFQYYLERHIDLDEEEHGPMAAQLMLDLCGTNSIKWQIAEQAAEKALEARLKLWDSVHQQLIQKRKAG